MLCAKNLKVALAAVLGVIGLAGVGTAHAAINLNPGSPPPNDAQYFAAETLAADSSRAAVIAVATTTGYNLSAANIPIGFLHDEGDYYLRFDLLYDGASNEGFASFDSANTNGSPGPTVTDANGGGPGTPSTTVADDVVRLQYVQGGAGVVFAIDPSGNSRDENIAEGTATINWALANNAVKLRVAEPVDQKTFSIRLSIWGNRQSAIRADFGSLGSQAVLWQSTRPIARTIRTISARVAALPALTASVATDFRRFLPGRAATGNLAAVTVTFTDTVPVASRAMFPGILNHEGSSGDATPITVGDVYEEARPEVMGSNGTASYNFGEFFVDGDCRVSVRGEEPMTREVPEGTAATADRVGITTGLTDVFTGTGTRLFCANVAANSATQTRYSRIEPVKYTMMLGIKIPTLERLVWLDGAASVQPRGPRAAGEIVRDGTTVRIGYLTTASDFGATRTVWENWEGGSYNQRLVIVNHGNIDAAYTLRDFVAEEGVDVAATAGATDSLGRPLTLVNGGLTGMVEKGSSAILRVRDIVTVTGPSRRFAATLDVVATQNNVSVATTQVTLPEGQTDTVRYWPLEAH